MNKTLLLSAFCLTLSTTASFAQVVEREPKLNGSLTVLMKQYRAEKDSPATRSTKRILRVGAKSYDETEKIKVIIDCENAEALAQQLQTAGHEATAATRRVVTARIPLSLVDSLVAQPEVKHIELSRKFKQRMMDARKLTKVDKVQTGTGLETPFTGKGVVIGVIDQGFQYRHRAFLKADGKTTRVIAGWNHRGGSAKPWSSGIPSTGERDGSHATHVTAIAAGTEVIEGYGGVAPDADIVMVPSSFNNSDIIEEAKFIKEVAEKAGKPWVINMSFGSQIGPHDGTTLYDRTIESMIGPGALVTAANGNEGGDLIHSSATLNAGETRFLIVSKPDETTLRFCFWGNNTDGQQHFKVTPILYADKTIVEPESHFWNSKWSTLEEGIDAHNDKQFLQGVIVAADMEKKYKSTYPNQPANELLLAFRIEALDTNTQPETFHFWLEPRYGSVSDSHFFTGERSRMLRGNDDYLVGEGASTIPSAISVASFNSSLSWTAMKTGNTYQMSGNNGVVNAPSNFSSPGPYLGNGMKPLVAAPGSVIVSAFNRFDSEMDPKESLSITHEVENGTRKDYYGVMQGTSMAAPFMAGVVALWLEAHPQLTYQQVEEVVKKTGLRAEIKSGVSTLDTADEWTPKRGYGRVDAYEGLKEVLKLATVSGIDHVSNSATPISLQKEADVWKILFNNAERFATIRVFSADGRLVSSQTFRALSQGQEILLPLSGLTPGAYLVNITTAGSNTTRRVMVK